MINEEKAKEIVEQYETKYDTCDLDLLWLDLQDVALQAMEWKDEQSILELGGWYKKQPTEDGWYLIKSNDRPKNCECMVAEWDNNAKQFYSEADDEPVSYREWKLIEKFEKWH